MARKKTVKNLRMKLLFALLLSICIGIFIFVPPTNLIVISTGIIMVSVTLSVGAYIVAGDRRVSIVVCFACLFGLLLSAFDMLDSVTLVIFAAFLVMLTSMLFSKDASSE